MREANTLRDAVKYLSQRARTEAELRAFLRKKGYKPEEIEVTLGKLIAEELICDASTADRWAAQLASDLRIGPMKAVARLQQRGIPVEVADAAVEKAWASRDDFSIASVLIRDCLGFEGHLEKEQAAKAARFLSAKGFRPECIARCLRLFE